MDGLVSLILFVVEFGFLITIILKNRSHPQFVWIITLMIFLQVYQLMEFLMCIGINSNIIGRMGLVSITFLPPLGVLLASYVTRLKHWINWSGLIFGVALSVYYCAVPNAFTDLTCNPFYATYTYPLGNLYAVFYFGYIIWAFVLIIIAFVMNAKKSQKNLNRNAMMVLIGYISFLLPMAITIIIDFSTSTAIPSIMCKYAILLAITLLIFSFMYERKPDIKKKEEEIIN